MGQMHLPAHTAVGAAAVNQFISSAHLARHAPGVCIWFDDLALIYVPLSYYARSHSQHTAVQLSMAASTTVTNPCQVESYHLLLRPCSQEGRRLVQELSAAASGGGACTPAEHQ